MRDLNRIKGCLVGGAVGDALGYAVEFSTLSEIIRKFGESGIKRYELDGGTRISMNQSSGKCFLFGDAGTNARIGAPADILPGIWIGMRHRPRNILFGTIIHPGLSISGF